MDATAAFTPKPLDALALDTLFRQARTFNYFQDRPVSEALLAEIAELAELGPTEANSLPGRFLFVTTKDGKEKLAQHLAEGNRAKTLAAPAAVVVAYDKEFYEHLPKTFPQVDARSWYAGRDEAGKRWPAERSTALQAGYLILAARAHGLDVGPMGGFDAAGVDAAFFEGTTWRSYVVMNIGYGDRSKLHPRNPRLARDEFVRFA